MVGMMRGPSIIRHHVVRYLETTFPIIAAKAEASWDLDYEFEMPEKFSAYEVTGIAHGSRPVIGVEVSRATGFARVDYDDLMAEQYRPAYSVRIYLWTYTPNAQDQEGVPDGARGLTLRARDDLTAILRATVLNELTLGQHDIFLVDEASLVEDYSEASPLGNDSGRWLAAASIGFDLQVDESLLREALGTVPAVGVNVLTALLQKVGE